MPGKVMDRGISQRLGDLGKGSPALFDGFLGGLYFQYPEILHHTAAAVFPEHFLQMGAAHMIGFAHLFQTKLPVNVSVEILHHLFIKVPGRLIFDGVSLFPQPLTLQIDQQALQRQAYHLGTRETPGIRQGLTCLLYTSDAADEL